MRRLKTKAPKKKKRSIAEIFHVEEEAQEQEQEQELEENPLEHQRSETETATKFWPLGEDVSVTVEEFQWLSGRLDELRSNAVGRKSAKSDGEKPNSVEYSSSPEEEEEKSEMVCPVCRVFKAATVTAANAHIDGCLAHAMGEERWNMRKRLCSNLKPKPQKKRSIAEILTVVPQIEARNGDVAEKAREEEEKNNRESVAIKSKKNINKNARKKKKKKMEKKVMKKKSKVRKLGGAVPLNDESTKLKKKKSTTKKKEKKEKKSLFNNELAAKKDDACKSKVQNSVNMSRKLRGTGYKTVKLDDTDASFTQEKKLDFKILSEEKKDQVKNCDSVGKPQKAMSPIRGILKIHKHISGSTSSGCNIQEGTEENHCDLQVSTSDRHVRFSVKDYILGPKDRNSFDETASNLASDALDSSLTKEQSSVSDEVTGIFEDNRRNDENTAISIDKKRKEVCPIVESKQFPNSMGQDGAQNFLRPCTSQETSKHLVEKGESSSSYKVAFCDKFDKGNTTPPHCSPHADVSGSISVLQAGQVSGTNEHLHESGASVSTRKFIDRLEDLTIKSATVNSNANTRTYMEPSSSYSASHNINNGNERPKSRLHSYGDNHNNGKALGGYMFSADMIDNSFLIPGQGKGSVRENRLDQNGFVLPLTSHGELISFCNSGKVGMIQPDTSCTLRGSLSAAPLNDNLLQNSQEYLSISERNVAQNALQDRVNAFPYYPARLGVTELHGREKADIYHHNNSDRCSSQLVRQLDSELNLARSPKMPNHRGNGMVFPKESSDLMSPSFSQPTMRLMGKDVPIGGISKEKQQFVRSDAWAGEEPRRRHYSEDAAMDNSLLGRCSGSQLQTSTENVLQSVKIQRNPSVQSTSFLNENLGVRRNASSSLHHTLAPTSCAVYNSRAPNDDLQWQFISGAKPQALSFQSQVLHTTPYPTSLSQEGELNDWKKHHHATSSAFGFLYPSLCPGVEEQAKTSLFQRSSRGLAPWLLGSSSTHERLKGNPAGKSFPRDTWGNNFATPSMNHSAELQYPPTNPVTSRFIHNAPLCPASIVQPPHVPVAPLTRPPSSAINSGRRNITQVTDRTMWNDMTNDDHHPCTTNTRKRPAANLIDLTKPNKSPNIQVQENFSCMTGLQRNAGAVEIDPRVNDARSKTQNESQNLNPSTSYLGFDSFKSILKPSQSTDQDNTRTIHSAIPISANTDCGRDLDQLQRRLPKMYRF